MDTHTIFVLGAFLVAGIAASYKLQFQALMYLLVVVYAVNDSLSLGVATAFFLVACTLSAAVRAGSKS
jgi:hypothetical protein